MKTKLNKHKQRKIRTRAKTVGTETRPRLSVHKTNKYIYAQIINDGEGKTLVSAKGVDAESVGKEFAKKAIAKKVKTVVFDRGGFKYHGKIKSLAEAARAGGLSF